MTRWNILALLLGLLLVAAPFNRQVAAEEDEYGGDDDDESPKAVEDTDVVVLTTSNFESTITGAKFALVEFYAPWCGHCKSLAPEYAKAATILKTAAPGVVLGKVDATQEAALAEKYGVQGYPTLKWFSDGDLASPAEYKGGRDADGIVAWIKKKSGPLFITVASVDELSAAEEENEVVALGYFSAAEGAEVDAFISAAKAVQDVVFAVTTEAAVAAEAGLTSAPAVAVIKNFKVAGSSREVVPFTGEATAEALTAFALAEKMPLSIEFSSANSEKIFNSGISKQIILWTKASDLAADAPVSTAFHAVAKKFKGQLVFVIANNEGSDHEPITNFFGLKDAEGPVLLGFQMDKNKKYKLKEPLSEAALEAFAASLIDGTLQADFKSAPIPSEDAALDGGVTVVVGKTFDSIVKNPDKDVLVEVYAPWCGHCKSLDPIYKKLAKRFKKVPTVEITKMDGTENEHPDIELKGYPYIALFPAGSDSEPVVFDGGDRSLKALTKFLKANAKIPFELTKKVKDNDTGDEKDEL